MAILKEKGRGSESFYYTGNTSRRNEKVLRSSVASVSRKLKLYEQLFHTSEKMLGRSIFFSIIAKNKYYCIKKKRYLVS